MRGMLVVLTLAAVTRADPALWDAPKRHSFVFKNIELELILEDLTNRYDRRIGLAAPGNVPMSWRARNLTWLEALDDLAATARLGITGLGGKDQTVKLVPGKRGPRFVTHAGGSRLSLEQVTVTRSTPLGAEPLVAEDEKNRIRLKFKWVVDKGLESAAITDLRLDKAVDDKRTLLGWKRRWEFPAMANRMFTISLAAGRRRTRSIKKLTGAFRVAIPTASKEIEFLPDDEETTKMLGGCEVTFHKMLEDPDSLWFTVKGWPCAEFKSEGRAYRVGAAITSKTRSSSSWSRSIGIEDIAVLLYNEKGKPIGGGRSSSYEYNEKEARWRFRLEVMKLPARIVMRAVTAVAVREVPFSFSDIPLP